MDKADWRDEFLSLLLSTEQNERDNARKLKKEHKPEKLYQYRAMDTAEQLAWLMQFIRNGELHCSTIETLNDPLDSKSVVSCKSYDAYLNENKTMKSEWIEQIDQFLTKVKLQNINPGGNVPILVGNECTDFANALQILKNDLEFRQSGDMFAGEPENTGVDIHSFNYRINQLTRYVRIASFSEEYNNMAMFAHYANRRSGVCLEFDLTNLEDDIFDGKLFPIHYIDKYPDAVKFIFDRLENNCLFPTTLHHAMLFCCLQKIMSWSYENEWRYVTLSNPKFQLNTSSLTPNEIVEGGFIKFAKPSKIILGDQMKESIKKELAKIGDEENINIPVFQIQFTATGIQEWPCNRTASSNFWSSDISCAP